MTVTKSTATFTLVLIAILIGIPCVFLVTVSWRTGQPLDKIVTFTIRGSEGTSRLLATERSSGPIEFVERQSIGNAVGESRPWIPHLVVCDLDQNGLNDVVFCDASQDQVSWIEQLPGGNYAERVIASGIRAPVHVTPSDVDKDGDTDLLVASMGVVFPNNDKIGSAIALVNDGRQQFTARILIDHVARVTDVEPGDFDGDGDIDLAVGQFGYNEGEIRWMENVGGDWQFKSHQLLNISGTIDTPVADMDGDGDLDIVALVSQEWEQVYVFANDGHGEFTPTVLYSAGNDDFGSSGISLADLDLDGDMDVLYTNGDAFDYIPPTPRPWHGVQWLENKGGLETEFHRIGDFLGAYSAKAADVDRDGDLDVVAVSAFSVGRVQPEDSVAADATIDRMGANSDQADERLRQSQAAAAPPRTGPSPETVAAIQHVRDELNQGRGDRERGAQVFKDTCAKCHRLFGEGKQVGPDLTQTNRMDREYLLSSIIDPNQAINARYKQYVVRVSSGGQFSGLVAKRSEDKMTLLDASGQSIDIAIKDIDEVRGAGVSLMPEGLISTMPAADVRDLFAFLQGEAPGPESGQVHEVRAQTMVWFENDGKCEFTRHDIATSPIHLIVLGTGDMDNDGWCDFVTGGMNIFPPFDTDLSRVTLWRNNWPNRHTAP